MADKNYGLATVVDAGVGDGVGNNSYVIDSNHFTQEQGFDRYINFAAIVNFGICLQSAWEVVGLYMTTAILNGGPATLVYGSIISTVGSVAVVASLAEMASIDPHVGAQYRWSALFATKNNEFWGLLQGWITVFAWTFATVSCTSGPATLIQAMISLWDPSYHFAKWHTTLLMWALLAGALLCNVFLRRILNVMETLGGLLHIIFFVVIVTILTTMGRRSTTGFVFNTLTSDLSGWNNPGICFNAGMLSVLLPLSGADSVLHMIDETKLPRKRIPLAMLYSVSFNAILMFAYILAVLFCVGDYEAVKASPLPILEVYLQATKSLTVATVLVVVQAAINLLALFNCLASVSRLIWAFARDNGLPFSNFFSYIHPTLKIPIPAIGLVVVATFLLSLINIGSDVAFNALLSLSTLSLNLSYVIPLYLLLIRKITGRHPQYGPFKLGEWGIPINLLALVFVLYSIFWVSFPSFYPVTAVTMNWAGPITIVVIAGALIDWHTSGKRRFKVPISQYELENFEGSDGNKMPGCH